MGEIGVAYLFTRQLSLQFSWGVIKTEIKEAAKCAVKIYELLE